MKCRPLAAVLILGTAAPAYAADEDVQAWLTLSASGGIKGAIVGQIEANARIGEDVSKLRQTLTRGTLGWRATDRLTLSMGYGHITQHRAGADFKEERVYPQIAWTVGKIGRGTLSTRARLEIRYVSIGSDTGWRYRQMVRWLADAPEGKARLFVQAEGFANLVSTDWGVRSGLDQSRAMVGVALPVTKNATLETGYLQQYVNGRPRDRLNHVVPLALSVRW